jgi:hypothetical protein
MDGITFLSAAIVQAAPKDGPPVQRVDHPGQLILEDYPI